MARLGISALLAALVLAGTAPASAQTAPSATMANPAAMNCARLGGTSERLVRGTLGEVGICRFKNGRACEEWALMRGECPESGVDEKPYATVEGRFCVLRGGILSLEAGQTDERRGTCFLPESRNCPVEAYWLGQCPRN
ncbi:MAG: putative hemolysin [Ferrovibrionaceae bacterium]